MLNQQQQQLDRNDTASLWDASPNFAAAFSQGFLETDRDDAEVEGNFLFVSCFRCWFRQALLLMLWRPQRRRAKQAGRQAAEHRKQEKGKITGNLHKIQLSECCLRSAVPSIPYTLCRWRFFIFLLYARVMNYHISCGFHASTTLEMFAFKFVTHSQRQKKRERRRGQRERWKKSYAHVGIHCGIPCKGGGKEWKWGKAAIDTWIEGGLIQTDRTIIIKEKYNIFISSLYIKGNIFCEILYVFH